MTSITHIIESNGNVSVQVPNSPLKANSLQITTNQPFLDWSKEEHAHAFSSLKKTISVWEMNQTANQYLVYGKVREGKPFSWEILPYRTPSFFLDRFIQQFMVLWRICFGSSPLTPSKIELQVKKYQSDFKNYFDPVEKVDKIATSNDAFCKKEVIDKQQVWEGHTFRILYNYAPIGFGGEKLHFLVVPKEHKERLTDLSEEEFIEASSISQKLIEKISEERSVKDVYSFLKVGKDAGQTVRHLHFHLVFSTNKIQDLMGKLTVFKNFFLSPSPMKDAALKAKVESLREELKSVNQN